MQIGDTSMNMQIIMRAARTEYFFARPKFGEVARVIRGGDGGEKSRAG